MIEEEYKACIEKLKIQTEELDKLKTFNQDLKDLMKYENTERSETYDKDDFEELDGEKQLLKFKKMGYQRANPQDEANSS